MMRPSRPTFATTETKREMVFSILDIHNHVGEILAHGDSDSHSPPADPVAHELESRLATLDSRGVQQAVIIGGHVYMRPDGLLDTQRLNDRVAAYRDRRPDRFPAAVGIVEPVYGERGLDEIDRCKGELGLAGLSFHGRFQGIPTDSTWVRKYLERMAEVGLIPFIHCTGDSPEEQLWQLDVLAADFPTLQIVVLDAFSTASQSLSVPHVAARRSNLLFDTAIPCYVHNILQAIRVVGAHRILYGSNLYSWPADWIPDPLPELLASAIAEEEKVAVLGGNARALLGL